MKHIKLFENFKLSHLKFINESSDLSLRQKQELLLDDIIVAESYLTIEQADEWFNEKYVTIYDLKTYEQFQGKGYATYLLEQIFNYVKNDLNLSIITLIVDKDNNKAVNLYFKCGFEIFEEYDDSYCLIKRL